MFASNYYYGQFDATSAYAPAAYSNSTTAPCQCADCTPKERPFVVSTYTHSPYSTPAPQVYGHDGPAAPAAPLPLYNRERSASNASSADWSFQPAVMPSMLPPQALFNHALMGMMPPPMMPHQQSMHSLNTSQYSTRSPTDSPMPPQEDSHTKAARPMMVVSLAMLEDTVGRMPELARTATGSSFLQAALRDRDQTAHQLVMREIRAHFGEMLLDAHACYVVKALMENMTHDALVEAVNELAADEQLLFSLCTHTLHSRRMVQFLLESLSSSEAKVLTKLMKARCKEVAKTQQGCIAMQRTLDRCTSDEREDIFNDVRANLVDFSVDPFANYVVQYMLEVGNKDQVSRAITEAFRGRVVELACNKFASNVIEKCLFHVDGEAQHELLREMYASTDDQLVMMLDDSFGNYIIQSSIALATFRDVWMISERLHPVLQRVPYGYKIESRLARRLKGKTAMGPRGRS